MWAIVLCGLTRHAGINKASQNKMMAMACQSPHIQRQVCACLPPGLSQACRSAIFALGRSLCCVHAPRAHERHGARRHGQQIAACAHVHDQGCKVAGGSSAWTHAGIHSVSVWPLRCCWRPMPLRLSFRTRPPGGFPRPGGLRAVCSLAKPPSLSCHVMCAPPSCPASMTYRAACAALAAASSAAHVQAARKSAGRQGRVALQRPWRPPQRLRPRPAVQHACMRVHLHAGSEVSSASMLPCVAGRRLW